MESNRPQQVVKTSVQAGHVQDILQPRSIANHWQQYSTELTFLYFAYGSCMCPVDLKRSLGENTHTYVIGSATLKGYRLAFNRRSVLRNCGVLDMVKDPSASVEGVLYRLPWRLSDRLDAREEIPQGGYRHGFVNVSCQNQMFTGVRTKDSESGDGMHPVSTSTRMNKTSRGLANHSLKYFWLLEQHST